MEVNLNKQRFFDSEIRSVLDEFQFISPNVLAVGGCVRDFLIGREYNDIDIASATEPQDVIKLAEGRGFKVYETGVEHGTVTLKSMKTGKLIEHTTFRKDVSTDGRRATVEFADDFKQDSKRRDFSICAMAMRRNGTVLDFHGGIQDLEDEVLSFVGNAEDRLEEDALRALRAFRFACRFDLEIQPDDLYLIAEKFKNGYTDIVSVERIFMEIEKAMKQLNTERWFRFVTYLSFNVIPYVFNIDNDGYSIRRKVSHPSVMDSAKFDAFIHNMLWDHNDRQLLEDLPLTVNQKRRMKFAYDLRNGELDKTIWKYRNLLLDTDIFTEDWFIQFLGFELNDIVSVLEEALDADWPDDLEGAEIGQWQEDLFKTKLNRLNR